MNYLRKSREKPHMDSLRKISRASLPCGSSLVLRPEFDFEPPATEDEIRAAASVLIASLITLADPRNRVTEAARARPRSSAGRQVAR